MMKKPITILREYKRQIVATKKMCLVAGNDEDLEKIQIIEDSFKSAIDLMLYWTKDKPKGLINKSK